MLRPHPGQNIMEQLMLRNGLKDFSHLPFVTGLQIVFKRIFIIVLKIRDELYTTKNVFVHLRIQ